MDIDDSNEEEVQFNNNVLNYKGYFIENAEEEHEPKYYEFGAHFRYQDLYKCLAFLREKQFKKEIENEKEKEKELGTMQINFKYNKKIDNKERNNTKNKNIETKKEKEKIEKKENKENINFLNIFNNFKQNARSRNIGIDNQEEKKEELTFIPFNNKLNNFSVKKEEENPNKSISVINYDYNKIHIYRATAFFGYPHQPHRLKASRCRWCA